MDRLQERFLSRLIKHYFTLNTNYKTGPMGFPLTFKDVFSQAKFPLKQKILARTPMKANGILAYVRTATSDTGMAILGKTTLLMISVETCTVLTISMCFLLFLI